MTLRNLQNWSKSLPPRSQHSFLTLVVKGLKSGFQKWPIFLTTIAYRLDDFEIFPTTIGYKLHDVDTM